MNGAGPLTDDVVVGAGVVVGRAVVGLVVVDGLAVVVVLADVGVVGTWVPGDGNDPGSEVVPGRDGPGGGTVATAVVAPAEAPVVDPGPARDADALVASSGVVAPHPAARARPARAQR